MRSTRGCRCWSALGSNLDPAMAQAGQILMMVRHPHLDGVAVRTRVDDPPHRVGHLLGGLGRRAGAHLIDERELEPLDLLLRGPLAQRGKRSAAEVVVPGALDHGEAVAECDGVRHARGEDTRTGGTYPVVA